VNHAARTGLVLGVCCVVLFSGFFIVSHADHDCRGDDCPLCLLARGVPHCARPPRGAQAFPAPPLLAGAPALPLVYAAPASSVRLKVRINR
jgi:hypothetical protein